MGSFRVAFRAFMWFLGPMSCFNCLILTGSISNLTGSDAHIFSHPREIFSENFCDINTNSPSFPSMENFLPQ